MGISNSTPRKLTMDNPDDATIIKVTENVVDRLQDAKTEEASLPSNAAPLDSGSERSGRETVYVSSLNIKTQMENAIESNNAYWENRIKVLRDGFRKINVELKNEYDEAVAEVDQSLGKQYLYNDKGDLQSCQNARQDVIQCYSANRNRPLQCYEEVRNFNQNVFNQTDIAFGVV